MPSPVAALALAAALLPSQHGRWPPPPLRRDAATGPRPCCDASPPPSCPPPPPFSILERRRRRHPPLPLPHDNAAAAQIHPFSVSFPCHSRHSTKSRPRALHNPCQFPHPSFLIFRMQVDCIVDNHRNDRQWMIDSHRNSSKFGIRSSSSPSNTCSCYLILTYSSKCCALQNASTVYQQANISPISCFAPTRPPAGVHPGTA